MSERKRFTEEELARLAESPWLQPFVEDDDDDLEAAQRRYDECIAEAVVHLRRRGIDVRSLAVTVDGRETTMLVAPRVE